MFKNLLFSVVIYILQPDLFLVFSLLSEPSHIFTLALEGKLGRGLPLLNFLLFRPLFVNFPNFFSFWISSANCRLSHSIQNLVPKKLLIYTIYIYFTKHVFMSVWPCFFFSWNNCNFWPINLILMFVFVDSQFNCLQGCIF